MTNIYGIAENILRVEIGVFLLLIPPILLLLIYKTVRDMYD